MTGPRPNCDRRTAMVRPVAPTAMPPIPRAVARLPGSVSDPAARSHAAGEGRPPSHKFDPGTDSVGATAEGAAGRAPGPAIDLRTTGPALRRATTTSQGVSRSIAGKSAVADERLSDVVEPSTAGSVVTGAFGWGAWPIGLAGAGPEMPAPALGGATGAAARLGASLTRATGAGVPVGVAPVGVAPVGVAPVGVAPVGVAPRGVVPAGVDSVGLVAAGVVRALTGPAWAGDRRRFTDGAGRLSAADLPVGAVRAPAGPTTGGPTARLEVEPPAGLAGAGDRRRSTDGAREVDAADMSVGG